MTGAVVPANVLVLREQVRTLQPGEEVPLDIRGRQINVIKADYPILLKFPSGGEMTLEPSLGYRLADDRADFDSFTIVNTDLINANDVVLAVSDGQVIDNRASIDTSSPVPVTVQNSPVAPLIGASGFTPLPATGSVQIAPVNQGRETILIQNRSAVAVLLNGGQWALEPMEVLEVPFRDAFTAETYGNFPGNISVMEG